MLAEGVERNPFHNNKVSSRGSRRILKDGAENFVWVAGVAAGEFEHGASNAARGIDEPVARRVLTESAQDGLGCLGDSRLSILRGHYDLCCLALGLHSLILPAPS